MKIAVTGASGLIGRKLVERLSQANHDVVHMVRDPQQASDAQHCLWEPERGIAQPEKLAGIDACIHLAGRNIAGARWTTREKQLIRASRIEATEILCRDLLKLDAPLKCFVSASAIGIYGECGDELVNDAHAAGSKEDFLVQTAIGWEAASSRLADQGIAVYHARFGVVLSPEGGALAKMLPLFRWGLGSPLGSGKQYWSWVALSDTARALEWMVNRSISYRPSQPTTSSRPILSPMPSSRGCCVSD